MAAEYTTVQYSILYYNNIVLLILIELWYYSININI